MAVRGVAQAIGEFEVLVQQVQKNASLVEHAISAISHAKACAGPPAGIVLDLQELQEHIETHRVKVQRCHDMYCTFCKTFSILVSRNSCTGRLALLVSAVQATGTAHLALDIMDNKQYCRHADTHAPLDTVSVCCSSYWNSTFGT